MNILLLAEGRVRLCDFAEGRYIDEDEGLWVGRTTWHFGSPDRRIKREEMGQYPPPPTVEDDLFNFVLSTWQLYIH